MTKPLLTLLLATTLQAQSDWPSYAHDPGAQRYSPLTQINTKTVSRLKPAWQYGLTPPRPGVPVVPSTEVTPIVANGLMYYPSTERKVAALDPESGKEIWTYDLGQAGAPRRGVTYWPGDKQNVARVFVGSGDGKLIALDAKTGKPVPGFGVEGTVDLRPGVADHFPNMGYHISSPPALYRELIITGMQGQEDPIKGPLTDVRAWDVRTGKLVWTFHLNPHPGEPGNETWPKDSWIDASSPAAWGSASVDTQRGIVYLPIGQPAPQYFGGIRPGKNLFSSSVLALEAATGKLKWNFQITHHDIWDYDVSPIPAFIDITRGGRKVPAVIAVSKISLMFFLNRATGEPIYPVEERPVPPSTVPGEAAWPTQPFPVKPPPLARQSIQPDEIFKGHPEHEKFCRELVEKIGGIHNQGPYTPYSEKEYRIIFPGQVGGVNFGGVAVDPKLGYVIVNSIDEAGMGILQKDGDTYKRFSPLGAGTSNARFWNPQTQWPCQPPPWAHLMAVNANTGDIAWKVTLGTIDELEKAGIKETGAVGPGGPITTAGGLTFIGATIDKRFHAFDSKTGKILWESTLDTGGHSTPMTYMGKNGKQYVAIVSSGVNAFALE
jgi:glucose dehydrogenase